jgi:hypothetical protein
VITQNAVPIESMVNYVILMSLNLVVIITLLMEGNILGALIG